MANILATTIFEKYANGQHNTLTGDSMVMVNTENQTILTMEILQRFHLFKLFLANVVPCSSTNVLVVFSEFEPVNPIFGEDETQTPVKDGNTNLLGKIELQLQGKMRTPALRSLARGLDLFCKMAQWTERRVYLDGVED